MKNVGHSSGYATNPISGRKRGPPKKIGELLSTYLETAGLHEVVRAQKMSKAWKASVPEKVYKGTRLIRVKNDVIQVGVFSSALLFELKGFYKNEILTKLRQSQIGYVREIRFGLEPPPEEKND